MQDAVAQPVGAEQLGGEGVAVQGQGQLAGEARLIEDERAAGESHHGVRAGEVVVEEGLDAPVGDGQAVRQPAAQLALPGQERGDDRVVLGVWERLADQGESQGDGRTGVCRHD